eukprot:scaffold74272_cov40-Attheya_sp.AAC.1
MPPVVLPIRGDPVHPLVTYQPDVLPDPMFDHPRHISPGITNFEDLIVMPGFHAYDHTQDEYTCYAIHTAGV